jgi:hypothetical protein
MRYGILRHVLAMGFVILLSSALAMPQFAQAAGVTPNVGDPIAGVGTAGKFTLFSPTGTLRDTLDTTISTSDSTGGCFDAIGDFFGTTFEGNVVSKFDHNDNLIKKDFITLIGGAADVESCLVNNANGHIFTGHADGTPSIDEWDATGAHLNAWTPSTSRGTNWIDLASDGKTIHYTTEDNTIRQFDTSANTQLANFATLPAGDRCFAHRILSDGTELVACINKVYHVDSSSTLIHTYPVSSLTTPTGGTETGFLFALNLDPDGTTFWTATLDRGNIYRINIASGAQVTSFNAGGVVEGLAIFGEKCVSCSQTPPPSSSKPPVGGIIVPVDMTSLFVAGAMTNAFWILPTLGGIAGAGLALFKVKRKQQ